MDWRTAAALIMSKVHPAITAAYFGAQGVQGAKEAYNEIQQGKATPENVQNFLLGLSTAVASGASSGGESGLSKVGELRKAAAENIQPFMRKATGVEPAVKEAVTKAVEKQSEAVETNRAKRADVIKDNLETQRGALNEIERKKIAAREKAEQENTAQSAEHEAKTSKAASDHAAEVKRIQEENQGAEQTLALRRQTETALKQKTDAYFAKEDQVKAKAKAADDENWTAWRDKSFQAKLSPSLEKILAPAYKPCVEFCPGRACHGEMRWEPSAGHVPRGFLGACGEPSGS